ncbi:MauE/DoxX family redox-associated membrane protein [uncultured Eudoraea sp.]|uniref:DoxX family protein n=1 Tax=uncultured Eudoraea sp. TaxID=1035614 RepID=UPI002627FABD|nr:MauE/DoxX family redox-associated membrane protein [uncultured Eudoraea sp.]
MIYTWHYLLMSFMYILAGIMHFIKPKAYLRIMPGYLPKHKLLVGLSGIAEIALGISLLLPKLKDPAIYGIILMLTIFLTVHFYMLSGKKASAGIPRWILLLRIPIQFALMYWAYWYLLI